MRHDHAKKIQWFRWDSSTIDRILTSQNIRVQVKATLSNQQRRAVDALSDAVLSAPAVAQLPATKPGFPDQRPLLERDILRAVVDILEAGLRLRWHAARDGLVIQVLGRPCALTDELSQQAGQAVSVH